MSSNNVRNGYTNARSSTHLMIQFCATFNSQTSGTRLLGIATNLARGLSTEMLYFLGTQTLPLYLRKLDCTGPRFVIMTTTAHVLDANVQNLTIRRILSSGNLPRVPSWSGQACVGLLHVRRSPSCQNSMAQPALPCNKIDCATTLVLRPNCRTLSLSLIPFQSNRAVLACYSAILNPEHQAAS